MFFVLKIKVITMSFITEANTRKIIIKTDLFSYKFRDDVFEDPIFFFSDVEKKRLLAYKMLIENSDEYLRYYKPIVLKNDTCQYVYERDRMKPAFHDDLSCKILNQDYKNFTIPDEIKKNTDGSINYTRVNEFRKWFKEVESLFESNKEAFVMRLHAKYGIVTNPKALLYENSGSVECLNYNIKELRDAIKNGIKKAGQFYYSSNKNKEILKRFSKLSYLGFTNQSLRINNTKYSDNEVKDFLKNYHLKFKGPLFTLIREYYRLTFNPDLDFSSTFLEALNFKRCSNCCMSKKEKIHKFLIN